MKIYGHPISTGTRQVLTILAERSAPFEFILVDLRKGENLGAAHLRRQPFGQIPVLEEGEFHLFESRAILRYLDQVLPGRKLTPDDAKSRAIMEQWISVEAENFTPHAMTILHEAMFKPMQGAEPDPALIQAGHTAVSRTLDILNHRLSDEPYFAGSHYTLADIGFMPCMDYLFAVGHGELIKSRANVAAWWARVSTRPAWRAATGQLATDQLAPDR